MPSAEQSVHVIPSCTHAKLSQKRVKIARTAGLEATEHVAKRPTYALAEVTLIAGHSHRLFQE